MSQFEFNSLANLKGVRYAAGMCFFRRVPIETTLQYLRNWSR